MPEVGDRVEVPSKRVGQTPRQGVVTAVTGTLLRVAWTTGEESTVMPSMGSLVVVGRGRVPRPSGPARAKRPARSPATGTARPTSKKTTGAPAKKSTKVQSKKSTKVQSKRAAKAAKAPVQKSAKVQSKTSPQVASGKRAKVPTKARKGPAKRKR
ncbi:MAG TPA: DUF1918 domain-containing protein [Acidimicrobiales bacterium]|nr:DUF1918 domain-containing protein [Acidimicrobiales bacterium]